MSQNRSNPSAGNLSILMPIFNEIRSVGAAVERTLATDLGVPFDLILVDDGSSDGTREWLQEQTWPENVRLLLHESNRGKGAAIRTGLEAATGEFATILDADLEYDPGNIRDLLEPIRRGEAEAVYGVRGFQAHSAYSFWYVVGNKAVTFAANLLYNAWLSDLMTCQKVIRTPLFRSLSLHANGFAIEAEITARLLRAGITIYEVPITYQARRRAEGKKLRPSDGIRVLATLARCRIG